ncbi:MAG: hypothetical protein LBE83_06275 [Propionibacteriaceae bacterium]|jgi:pentose-5-phosphate-3-epimerase|nr:hypothetical protein [Propionibacteriaceae bacterium]
MRVGCSLWNVAGPTALEQARRLVTGGVELFHWDRADGIFAPAGGFQPAVASAITADTQTRAEAHLMVADPLAEVDQWCEFCELVVIPVEVDAHRAAIRRIEQRGRIPGVAISPTTPLTALAGLAGLATLVMSVHPGQAGAKPDPLIADRLASLERSALLGVDGGLTLDLAQDLRRAGATWVAVGTALVQAEDPATWLAALRRDVDDDYRRN